MIYFFVLILRLAQDRFYPAKNEKPTNCGRSSALIVANFTYKFNSIILLKSIVVKKVKRLVSQFKPDNYRLFLDPDIKKMTFTGRVQISGYKSGRPSSRITLHQKDLKIKSASLIHIDKKEAREEVQLERTNLHAKFDELRLHAVNILYPGNYIINLEFSGKITEQMHGIYPCYFDDRKKCLIATQFESHHAREVFPCIDEPEAKATFDLTLVTPKGQTVLANTPIKTQETSGSKTTTSFEASPIMSSYLLAFVFGDLVYKEAKTKNNVPVRTYATEANKDLLDFSIGLGVKCIDFFEEYFNTPYPLAKLDMVALPEFSSGAMENWGLITYRESMLLTDPKISSIESQQITAYVVAHESSHMWFGNLVTMKWWDDLWLNESFANMMEYVAVDGLFPEWKVWEQFTNSETAMAMSRDSLPNVQSVKTPVNHPDEIGALFDPAIVYAKGGNILNMLRHLLGEEKFRLGLARYFKKFAYGNTQASDLWEAFESVSNIKVSDFMHNWLNYPGFPVVDINYIPDQKQFSASQTRLTYQWAEPKSTTIWQIPLFMPPDGDKLLLSKKTGSFKLNIVPKTPIFNHDGQGYFVANYVNAAHFDKLKYLVASNNLDTINRLQLVQGYNLMEKSGLIKSTESLALVGAYKDETDEAVWGSLASTLGNARRLVKGDMKAEKNFDKFCALLLEKQIKKVGWDQKKGESAKDQRLRSLILSLGASAKMPKVHSKALELFAKFKKPDDLPADVRGVVYYVAARFGNSANFNKLLKLYMDVDNADEKNEVASALCSTQDPVSIKKLLSMITTDKVRLQDAISWYVGLLRNYDARSLAWQWQVDNWQWIEKYFSSDKSYDYFPRAAASIFSTQKELLSYKDFFTPKANVPGLSRTINLGIEELENNVSWRSKNEQAVKEWLENRV